MITCSLPLGMDASPGIFRPGQLVEVGVNIRALRAGPQVSVIVHMESLMLHDRYGVKVCFILYLYYAAHY